MQSQLRVAQLRAVRSAPRRGLASIPPTPPPSGATPPPSGATPVRPVVVGVRTVPTPGSSTLPPTASGTLPPPPSGGALPPPPPPPPKGRGFFSRVLLYTTVGALIFYPVSGLISTQSETYREFFTETFPAGEFVADQIEGVIAPTPTRPVSSTSAKVDRAVREARAEAEAKARAGQSKAQVKAGEAKEAVSSAAASAQRKAEEAKAAVAKKAEEAKAAATKKAEEVKAATLKKAEEAKAATKDAVAKTEKEAASLKERLAHAATQAKDKITETASAVPFNAGDGIEGVVRKVEGAVGKGEEKVKEVVESVKPDPNAPRVLPDTQRPRELRPETVKPSKPSFEGQEKYTGTLPLGFEPPPGYYVPPPPKAEGAKIGDKKLDNSPVPARPALPLLAPQVKDFGTDEPIISQLASTIDSLASSLSAGAASGTAAAGGVLSKAQADLSALSTRLSEVKKAEKAKLEKALADKTKEFETTLKNAEKHAAATEQGLQDKWLKERQSMVDEWNKKMEGELEGQREGIEKRLREEVVSQGIELQRRWLRSIKAQVEEERGGRLAKLDHLSTSLKQLERITLDNSATLDDNVRVHKIWSALRAVQTKAEAGDVSFDEELRVLKSLSTDNTSSSAVSALEASGVAITGVKSLASLSSWFSSSVAPRVQSTALVPAPEKAGVVSHLASWGLSGLMFKPTPGPVEGNDVSAVLARAEWCLAEKDLDGAAREVNRLSGWPKQLAGDWLREARRALEVKQALEVVATEATLSSLLLV